MWLEVLIVCLLISIAAYFWYQTTKRFNRWRDAGVPYVKPSFPFGSFADLLLRKKHIIDILREHYKQFSGEKVYGTFMMGEPILNINDPDIIKHILVKDFDSFKDRINENTRKKFCSEGNIDKYWVNNPMMLMGEKWKQAKEKLGHIFTKAKIKLMEKFLRKVNCRLVHEMEANDGKDVELKTLFGKYSMDSLVACNIGMDAQSFEDECSSLVKNAEGLFSKTTTDMVKTVLNCIPGIDQLFAFIGVNIFAPKQTKVIVDIIEKSIKKKKSMKHGKEDLLDMMRDERSFGRSSKDMAKSVLNGIPGIDQMCAVVGVNILTPEQTDVIVDVTEKSMKDKKEVKHNKSALLHMMLDAKLAKKRVENKNVIEEKEDDEMVMTASLMFSIIAGYVNISMSLAFVAWHMAKNAEIREKLQKEIDKAFEDNDGEMPDYSEIQTMTYLDQVIHEMMRFHPFGALQRSTFQDYTIPGTDITLKKDEWVWINAPGIHYDPVHYPNPHVFNPEHFSTEAKAKRGSFTFFGFGEGPRGCMGKSLALFIMKMALVNTMRRFTFVSCERTGEELELDPSSIINGYVKGGIWAKIVAR